MNDTIKHVGGTITSATGFLGAITLENVNTVVSIGCGVAGLIAACFTIASVIKKWNK